MNNLKKLQAEMPLLDKFISRNQIVAIAMGAVSGEEREFFIEKGLEMAETFKTMPKTYEQDGLGDKAIVHLHYFRGNADVWITERDMGECPDTNEISEQSQAFGLSDLGMGCAELGYVSIEELKECGFELDLYWTPKTLAEVKA